ncbi:response regulator [Desulfoscipio gibsoniae]|uniref:Stage 0 sporulation protein A homolog n=1 Tax=Desulfoscipio gibsoniae DSM 7213 TaxID=767817 RepID=R4KR33_9FIRM|nr:response regulator [Desulfoscipio gibsoniae]AGL03010.1 response regulator with CheY-like receiver, AAA-type ATPase, and DNA-binding domains [Desulfoscipio gibsoniae DSM 7213]
MKRFLIIDDDEGMCWALKKALEHENRDILTATSGSDGLALFDAYQIDLILLDIKMQDTNGLDVLQQIRQKNLEVPVLIMTGYSSLSIALQAIEKGATGYITKPVQIPRLKETIQKIFPEDNITEGV